jgi:hypothetical protein
MSRKNSNKRVTMSVEESKAHQLKRELGNCRGKICKNGLPTNERKIFKVGEKVTNNHNGLIECSITEIIEEGIYKTKFRYITTKPYSSELVELEQERIETWLDLFKDTKQDADILIKPRLGLQFMQQSVGSLILTYKISFGLDMNPDYQRDLVWDLSDKQKLIESIFNQIDIGKFVLIHLDHQPQQKYYYEVLDGKQRINALYEFYTDQFTYKGYYFSDLSFRQRSHIDNYAISIAMTSRELTEKEKIEYFLSLNNGGKQVSEDHLNKISKRLENL